LLRSGSVEFCFQCTDYPCARLGKLDRRYRTVYGNRPLANLVEIPRIGVAAFNHNQQGRYGCATCGGKISMHNRNSIWLSFLRRGADLIIVKSAFCWTVISGSGYDPVHEQ